MDQILQVIDFLRHLDRAIETLIANYGPWTYGILFATVFAETGFVVTPFLPGDTLLFAAGMFSHGGENSLNVWIVLFLLTLAPLCGDTVNYHMGKWLGPKIFKKQEARFLNRKNLERTQAFFAKYGSKTIILARWVPIVRTFAPFVAGMSGMPYPKFFLYSFVGAVAWVWICVGAGYFFGRIPIIRDNFELAMLGLILVTVTPIIVEAIKHKRELKKAAQTADEFLEPEPALK